jgi:type IV pilus assembly protein PilB
MDNNQVLDLFVSRSMIDGALKADVLAAVENTGKEAAEILVDYQVVNSRDDIWPIIAQELGAEFAGCLRRRQYFSRPDGPA